MSELDLQLPKLDLRDARIWLSGSIPEPTGESPDIRAILEAWSGSELERGILGFVQEFASLAMNYGGQIIHGCHPSFTPILLDCVRGRNDVSTNLLELCASQYFVNPDDNDWNRWSRHSKTTLIESTGGNADNRDTSLAVLRDYMAEQCTAFVAVGGRWWSSVPGRAGVPRELERAKVAGVPCFILGGFGGASQTYVQENPDWTEGLNNGLSRKENEDLSRTTSFALAAGRIASQLQILSSSTGESGFSGMSGM